MHGVGEAFANYALWAFAPSLVVQLLLRVRSVLAATFTATVPAVIVSIDSPAMPIGFYQIPLAAGLVGSFGAMGVAVLVRAAWRRSTA
jgi:hypothetical protein